MGMETLDDLLKPKRIAVIGASEQQGSIGNALMCNLIQGGYRGDIYPISSKYKTIWGRPAVASIRKLGFKVDLAVLATPIAIAPRLIRGCVQNGVGAVMITCSGDKENGAEDGRILRAIRKEVEKSALRILGPNCLGVVSTDLGMNATFAGPMPVHGRMAFISQSSSICNAAFDLSVSENIGFSYLISVGDMLDVDFGELIDYLGAERNVDSIVLYIERLSRFRNFISASRAVSRVKPIVALKTGRSCPGELSAASHTGSLASKHHIYDAAFRRAGILCVKTLQELFDCAELLSKQPVPKGPGLAILTNAAGPGLMAADALSDFGYGPASLSDTTLTRLDKILPPLWNRGNPVNLPGDASPETFCRAVDILLQATEINGLLIVTAPRALTDTTDIAEAITGSLRDKKTPVFTCWVGSKSMARARTVFNTFSIPTFDTPERAVRAFVDIYRNAQNILTLQEIPPRLPCRITFDFTKAKHLVDNALAARHYIMTEDESKALLSAYGIPVIKTVQAETIEESIQKAKALGYPVAMKANLRQTTYKTNVGGVMLNLKNASQVKKAYERIMGRCRVFEKQVVVDGVTIRPMLESPGYELLLGIKKDRDFGPVIIFGTGGALTEIFEDTAIELPPLNQLLARKLMEQTKAFRLFDGSHNILPAGKPLLEEILIRLSQLAMDFPEIEVLEVNPLVVTRKRVCAVDVKAMLQPPENTAPLHMVISPYPVHFEEHVRTGTGVDIFIRFIRPEDAPLLIELFESLSQRSIYMRFFMPLKEFPRSIYARFTQIDYDREIALVALTEPPQKEMMLGVARVITERDLKAAEFSVVVGDPWQGKGIGAELLKRCLEIARKRKIEKVHGVVLSENTQMIALGRKMGFEIKREPGSKEFELYMDLSKTRSEAA